MGVIRFLLAISVVIAHSDPLFGNTLWGGVIAVELFFIISGFYMAMILNEKYNTTDKIMVFYKNRILKLFPIYWTILCVTILLSISSYILFEKGGVLKHIHNNMDDLGPFLIYIALTNIFLIGEDLLMFLGYDGNAIVFTKSFVDTSLPFHQFIIVPQSWTLSLEIIFYIIAPFITRKSIGLLLTLLTFSVILKISLWFSGYVEDPWNYRFIFSEFSFFFMGMLMYRVYRLNLYDGILENKYLFFIGFLLILLSGLFYFELKELLIFNDVDILKYIIYMYFILFLPILFDSTKNNKIDRYIGELSYPIYIVHILVIYFVNKMPISGSLSFFVIIGSVIISILLNKFIQEKIEKIRIYNFKEN
ncbi:MAG: peptidoglycan/LPS O-acetylase OafA/YrhL [Oleispira sp.]